jgi:hypothetical protein
VTGTQRRLGHSAAHNRPGLLMLPAVVSTHVEAVGTFPDVHVR